MVPQLDIGHGHGVGAVGDGVGLVVRKGELVHLLAVDGVEEGVDGAVALPLTENTVSLWRMVPKKVTWLWPSTVSS